MENKNYSEDYVSEEKKFQFTRGMAILVGLILIVLIVIIVLIVHLVNSKKPEYETEDFKYLELRMSQEAPTYLSQKNMELTSDIIKIDLKDLLTTNGGFIDPSRVKAAKICDGYVNAYKNESINYDPYIKCGKYYTTEGYIDTKEKKSTTTKVKDTNKPDLTLKGEKEITITVGETYKDEGATAIDDVDKDITSKIKVNSNVDTSKPGTYTVTYKVSDKAGNTADITRTVTVIEKQTTTTTRRQETTRKTTVQKTTKRVITTTKQRITTPPTLTLNAPIVKTMKVGESYIDPGYVAYDAKGLNITGSVRVSGSVNTNVAGTYTLTYTVTDSYGNHASKMRTVKVESVYVKVTNITVTPNAVTLNVNGTQSISVGYYPNNATNKSVTYSTNNSRVATVSNGVIKGISRGVATITVKSIDGPSINIPVTVK